MSSLRLRSRHRRRGALGGSGDRLGPRRVRRPALPHVLLAEAVVGARAHGLRARARDRRGRARHAPASSARATRRASASCDRYGLKLIRPEIITVAEQHKQEGPKLWERDPDRCCHIRKVEPLIRALERTTPGSRASAASSRPRARTPASSSARSATTSGRCSRSPTGARTTCGATSGRTTSPSNPLHDLGLPFDRLHPLHAAHAPRRRGARRPVGGHGQAGMRPPSGIEARRGMTDHIYAAEHPSRIATARRFHHLVHRTFRLRQDARSPHLLGPALDERGAYVEYLDGDIGAHAPLARASGSPRRTATRTSGASAGRLAADPARRRGDHRPRSPRTTRRARPRARWSRSTAPSSRCS